MIYGTEASEDTRKTRTKVVTHSFDRLLQNRSQMEKLLLIQSVTLPFLFSMVLQVYWRLCKCWTWQSVQTVLTCSRRGVWHNFEEADRLMSFVSQMTIMFFRNFNILKMLTQRAFNKPYLKQVIQRDTGGSPPRKRVNTKKC